MTLPFLISVPHAGLQVPRDVRDICTLTPEQIYADSDGGAAEIYFGLQKHVEAFIAADVARAIVDLNRGAADFGKDGVIKTHTCYGIPVYREFPAEELINRLLAEYYFPYHQRLKDLANKEKIGLGIDCHTMAQVGPPVGPDPGKERPLVCLSNGPGTCPDEWLHKLAECFEKTFPGERISINSPFRGGYLIRNHSAELPWLQIELSRTEKLPMSHKKNGVQKALSDWCKLLCCL